MFSNVNLVLNFRADNQQSILRYGEILEYGIGNSIGKNKVKTLETSPVITNLLNRNHSSNRLFSIKNASYIDRLLFFNTRLLFSAPGLYHVVCQPEYVTSLAFSGKTTILTCHDLIPLLQEQENLAGGLSQNSKASFLLKWWRLAYTKVEHVICVSENTRNDLLKLIDINIDKTTVIYNGLNRLFQPVNHNQAKKIISQHHSDLINFPFILNVGSSYVHKNRPGIIEVFNLLADDFPDLQMVFCGKKFSEIEIQKLNQSPYKSRIHILVDVTDLLLDSLYSLARLMLFPSLYEGFGWPVIEAMACGCPAIGSNQGSLKEIVLESTFAPEPTDYREITNLCRSLLIDENYRQNIIAKGLKYVEKFSTNHMISQYLAVYQKLGLQL